VSDKIYIYMGQVGGLKSVLLYGLFTFHLLLVWPIDIPFGLFTLSMAALSFLVSHHDQSFRYPYHAYGAANVFSVFVHNLFIPVSSLYTSIISLYFCNDGLLQITKRLLAIYIYGVGEATYRYHRRADAFQNK